MKSAKPHDMESTIRPALRIDLPELKEVIATTGLFPPEMLDGMMADYWNNPDSGDIWLTAVVQGKPTAVAYCAPERLTDGTYNLYLIAVHKDHQGKHIGRTLLHYVEQLLQSQGKRILLVETSGLPEFELTRKFYDQCHYHREAVIRDFYRQGEDKVIFWKQLT